MSARKNLKLTDARISQIRAFQESYLRLVAALGGPRPGPANTSGTIGGDQSPSRITGDAVTWIIEEVIAMKGKIKIDGLQEAIDAFIDSQVLIPGKWRPVSPTHLKSNTLKSRLLQKIQENLEAYKESI